MKLTLEEINILIDFIAKTPYRPLPSQISVLLKKLEEAQDQQTMKGN